MAFKNLFKCNWHVEYTHLQLRYAMHLEIGAVVKERHGNTRNTEEKKTICYSNVLCRIDFSWLKLQHR